MTFKENSIGDKYSEPLRICLLGDTAVGKTSLCKSLCLHHHIVREDEYNTTIGFDIYKTQCSVGSIDMPVEIFDLSTDIAQSKMIQNVLHSVDAILLVYDITHLASFKSLEHWMNTLYEYYNVDSLNSSKLSLEERLPFLGLIGNKKNRSVPIELHLDFVKNYKLYSYFVNGKVDHGDVVACLKDIVNDLYYNDSKENSVGQTEKERDRKVDKQQCSIS